MPRSTDYTQEAKDDARETAREFIDKICEDYVDEPRGVSDDLLNDYPNGDAWHHENHVDKSYNLQEAAELLDELRQQEETDSGLWEGLAPREAISAQAAHTYGNAVYSEWRDLVKEINDDSDLEDLKEQLEALDSTEPDDEQKINELKAAIAKRIGEVIDEF
jgi:chaperonin cofactor prefoldin